MEAVQTAPFITPNDDLPELNAEAFRQIAEFIFRHTGIRLGPGKEYFVECRLADLFRSLDCSRWEDLPTRVERAPGGLDRLIGAVVTPETRFFRDDLPFRALRDVVLPAVRDGAPSPFPLRIWSAGCSTGQEPYSVAMSLWDLVKDGEVDLAVWATDICEPALDCARRGVYSDYDLSRGLDPATRDKFFHEEDRAARVRREIRSLVSFERLNLVDPPALEARFHVVFCRNVGIYFGVDGKRRLYSVLGDAVLPGGYLILGAAETLFPGVNGFETVYFENLLLYRKVGGGLS